MRKRTIIIYMAILFILVGCKSNKEKTQFKQKDKAPDSLGKISDSLDSIFKTLDKIEKIDLGLTIDEEKPKEESSKSDQGNKNDSGSSGQETKDKESGKTDNSKSQGESGKEKQKEEKLQLAWKEIDDKLVEAHSSWNKYEGEATAKGVTQEKKDVFNTSLNKMTKSIENRNIIEIYDFGSQTMLGLRAYYDLYQDEFGGDIAVLKYVGYQSYLRAISDDIPRAKELFVNREENINRIRLKLGNQKEKIKILDKASNSLNDMKQALEEKSKRLLMIKKEILIKNLKAIE